MTEPKSGKVCALRRFSRAEDAHGYLVELLAPGHDIEGLIVIAVRPGWRWQWSTFGQIAVERLHWMAGYIMNECIRNGRKAVPRG